MERSAKVRAVLVLSIVGAAAPASIGQVIDARWIDDTSGDWTDPARWSTPDYPTRRGADVYRAIVDFDAGGPYTISLGVAVDLDGLVLTSADATLDGNGGAGRVVVRSTLEFGDATARALAELMSEGTLLFTADTLSQIDDTPLCHVGSIARKTGTGNVALLGSSILELTASSTFTIENSGDFVGDGTAQLRNAGTFIKQSPGLTRIEDVAFTNTGTVAVAQGTLQITNPQLPSAGTLGPSTYDIAPSATLDLPGTTLSTNQADVLFRGAGATFAQLASISTNQGLIQAENAAIVALTNQALFTNDGSLVADGQGSRISIAGDIDNTANGDITVLNGGIIATTANAINNTGTVQGNGNVQSTTFINNGLVSPGNSPGVLVSEDPSGSLHTFQQGPAGTLLIEIAGRLPGTGHDVLDVRGLALLDGTLELRFMPFTGEPPIQVGDTFQILLADGLDGRFRQVLLRGLGGEGQVEVLLTPAGVSVVVREVPAPAGALVLGLGVLAAAGRRRRTP